MTQLSEVIARLATLEAGGIQSEALIASNLLIDPDTGVVIPPGTGNEVIPGTALEGSVELSDNVPNWDRDNGTPFALAPEFGLVPSGAPLGRGFSFPFMIPADWNTDAEGTLSLTLICNALVPSIGVVKGELFTVEDITSARGSIGLVLGKSLITTDPAPFVPKGKLSVSSEPVQLEVDDGEMVVLGITMSGGYGEWTTGGAALISAALRVV